MCIYIHTHESLLTLSIYLHIYAYMYMYVCIMLCPNLSLYVHVRNKDPNSGRQRGQRMNPQGAWAWPIIRPRTSPQPQIRATRGIIQGYLELLWAFFWVDNNLLDNCGGCYSTQLDASRDVISWPIHENRIVGQLLTINLSCSSCMHTADIAAVGTLFHSSHPALNELPLLACCQGAS